VLVLGVPMYNFGPPAGFKAWIDNVVRVGETFGFDPQAADPYTPLLADRPRSVVLLTARGASGMGPGGPLAHANHLDGAVREVLVGLLGMRDWHSVAIEHDETGGEALAQSVAAAMQATDRLAAQLFERHRLACREPAVAL
jgi:FMN-dependent NADH-azoreductase